MALKRQTAALEGLFQVRIIHVFLGKELMMRLMQYYTSYFISPKAHANTTQEEAVIRRRRKSTPSKHIKRVHDRLSLKIGDLAL